MSTIKNISVIGAGTMGSGIATISLISQYKVNLVDISEDLLRKAKSRIEKNLAKSVEKGIITNDAKLNFLNNLNLSTDFASITVSDLIIEAVSENMDIKIKLFSELCEFASETAIIASNTSALKISDLASLYKNPEYVLGIHFFNPPVVMKLVELVKTKKTSDAVYEVAENFVSSLNKQPVQVKESPGFIVNRVLIPMINEAAMIYAEGVASAKDIDTAMCLGANHPIGPLALADMIGIDVCLSIMETLQKDMGSDKYKPASILEQMVKEGNLGKKSGAGFHDYRQQPVGAQR